MMGIGHWELLILGLLCCGGFVALLVVGFVVFLVVRQTQGDSGSTTCPHCHKNVPQAAGFCPSCGNKVH